MFLIIGIVSVIFLLYKWITANNDYFKKRGIPFKPADIFSTAFAMASNKKPITEWLVEWYNELEGEKYAICVNFRLLLMSQSILQNRWPVPVQETNILRPRSEGS